MVAYPVVVWLTDFGGNLMGPGTGPSGYVRTVT